MMKPCKKCGHNSWDYLKLDNDPHIYCTCKNCGYKLSFLVPKKFCSFCLQPADFEKFVIDEKTRGKKCLLCGEIKVLDRARAFFRSVNGVLYLFNDEDELYHETKIIKLPGGAIQQVITEKVLHD